MKPEFRTWREIRSTFFARDATASRVYATLTSDWSRFEGEDSGYAAVLPTCRKSIPYSCRKILDSVGLFVNATSDPENDFTRLLISRKILDSVGLFVNATSDPQNDFTELLISLFKHGR
ncbi:hypothetical protein J6590_071867 [Homalodisca vitripennis]|nr:hypothetical protein J6590_071867 [Homalodisca vitripennis]